jgi:predicted RNase H-like nuclease (RuvC/YqgF family)
MLLLDRIRGARCAKDHSHAVDQTKNRTMTPETASMPDEERRAWEERGRGWDRSAENLDRTLGRLESKIDGMDRAMAEVKREMSDRRIEFKIEIDKRFSELDRRISEMAKASDVDLVKRIVFGAVAVILIGFVGGAAWVRWTVAAPIPSIGARP